ncbi:MAG TPA: hypothetical protein P5293_05680 [Bacteroidales bacterium]|nr:hypothetical protein [Bacteroidales bacterium]
MDKMDLLRKEIVEFRNILEKINEEYMYGSKDGWDPADYYSDVMYRASIFFARISELV